MSDAQSAVEFRGITKHFGPVRANDGIDFIVKPGTVHAVIGENGAGKSTAMKILYGLYRPDQGELFVEGKPASFRSPLDALARGIGMVHQHFMLSGPHSALDNVILGAEPQRTSGLGRFLPQAFRPIDRAKALADLQALSHRYALPVDWEKPIEDLSVGVQQRVEILKLLYRNSRILILDEPTAVLTPQETHELFTQLRRLSEEGRTVLVVTHKLKEVMAYTDAVTVFRAGKVTGFRKTLETSTEDLAELMVGRRVVLRVARSERPAGTRPVLEVKDLGLNSALNGVSFSVNQGEIVGVAGVEGNGQSELIEAILNPEDSRVRFEKFRLLSKDCADRSYSTRDLREEGVALIPQDRHQEGLLLERSCIENFALGQERRSTHSRSGLMKWEKIQGLCEEAMERHDVRPRISSTPVKNLSGGNQQKLIIARELGAAPRFLIAAQPTRGVDVGAIESIHKNLIQERERGVGILLISSELDELLSLSDRILVLYRGQIVSEFSLGEFDEKKIGLAMGGAST